MEEKFVDIKGFEGVYRIGDKGTLLSCKKRGKPTQRTTEWRVLPNVNAKGGYFSVILQWMGKVKYTRIHRLVYEHFVGEIPKGHKWHIHHKDGNKQNNCVENLELLSSAEHYSKDKEKHTTVGMNYYNQHIKPQKIVQKDLDGNFIAIYENATEAGKATGVCVRNILQVAMKTPTEKGYLRKTAGGYKWEAQSR